MSILIDPELIGVIDVPPPIEPIHIEPIFIEPIYVVLPPPTLFPPTDRGIADGHTLPPGEHPAPPDGHGTSPPGSTGPDGGKVSVPVPTVPAGPSSGPVIGTPLQAIVPGPTPVDTQLGTLAFSLAGQIGAPSVVPSLADILSAGSASAALPTNSGTSLAAPPSLMPAAPSSPGLVHVEQSPIDMPLNQPTDVIAPASTTADGKQMSPTSIQPDDSLAMVPQAAATSAGDPGWLGPDWQSR